jgi:hypothetical protein
MSRSGAVGSLANTLRPPVILLCPFAWVSRPPCTRSFALKLNPASVALPVLGFLLLPVLRVGPIQIAICQTEGTKPICSPLCSDAMSNAVCFEKHRATLTLLLGQVPTECSALLGC